MTASAVLAYYDHNHVLSSANASVPAGKKQCSRKTLATPDLIRLKQGFRESLAIIGEQVGVFLCHMPFAIGRELDFVAKKRTGKARHALT